MHFEGLVFSHHPQNLMDSLIQTSGQRLAEVRIPLDLSDDHSRSGWYNISDEHRLEPSHSYWHDSLTRSVWPTEFLRENLGPHALLPESALASLEISRRDIEKKDGQWWAQIPRFFQTIGVFWSMTYRSPRWQEYGWYDQPDSTTVSGFDLDSHLDAAAVNLIVGPD